MTHALHSTLSSFTANVRQGKPVTVHNLTVVPLFAPSCELPLMTLAQALEAATLTVTEVDAQGDVNCLRVLNDGDIEVLIFDGEELVGAKQNRIVNTSIVVPRKSELRIPVSCVEQGRWSYRSSTFASGTVMKAAMRRTKLERVHRSLRDCGEYDADQGAVWSEVREYAARKGSRSPTMALTEVVELDRGHIEDYVAAVPCALGQTGLAAFIDGVLASIDIVAEPAVYASLHAKLVASLASEALDREPAPARKRRAAVSQILASLEAADVTLSPSPGIGSDARLENRAHRASVLLVDDKVVHLSVFPS